MEYRLELKSFQRKDGWKYKIIQLTDIKLHMNKRPSSFLGKIKKAFESNTSGRIYDHMGKLELKKENLSAFDFPILSHLQKDPEFVKYIREEEQKGYKILFGYPKSGLPICAGEDIIEFMNSTKGKRIFRWLTKVNPFS